MTTRCLAVTGGGNIGKCGKSGLGWLSVRTIVWSYLLTYYVPVRVYTVTHCVKLTPGIRMFDST